MKVVGLARIASDVTPKLAVRTHQSSITVLGALQASPRKKEGALQTASADANRNSRRKRRVQLGMEHLGARLTRTHAPVPTAHRSYPLQQDTGAKRVLVQPHRRWRLRMGTSHFEFSLAFDAGPFRRGSERYSRSPRAHGSISFTQTGKSGSRAYRAYVPASAADDAAGLVMMLHGCTQTPEDFAAGTGMNALADRHGFVVLYPEGCARRRRPDLLELVQPQRPASRSW